MESLKSITTPDCEIVSTRLVNFTVQEVFSAWSEPALLKEWWGPKGFTNTFHEFDFKVGGKWLFTMHGPEKGNYQNECEFLEIDPPHFIVWKRHSQPLFKVAVSFESVMEAQTKIVFRMVFDSTEEREKLIKFVPEKNEENFDKLESVLSKSNKSS